MTRQLKHRKKRRELGLCAYEGCPEQTGQSYHCTAHRKWAADHTRNWRVKRELERLRARDEAAAS